MANITTVDKFPKDTFNPDDVAAERNLRLSILSVISCTLTDDGTNWVLTTVFAVGAAGGAAPKAPAAASPAPAVAGFGSLVPGGFFSSTPNEHNMPRPIRTNNPGALNISNWQKSRPGYVGATEPDGSSNKNVTTIYRTPEHGVGSWYHMLTHVYGLGANGNPTIQTIAQHYAGRESGPDVNEYLAGWAKFSGNSLAATTTVSLAADQDVLVLAKAMFGHEAGKASPLHDDQILYAVQHERAGTLPT